MGKKQHQKDKLYLTCTEWSQIYGGKKETGSRNAAFKRLPFSCCSLSFQPFENPYCTTEGVSFDLMNIVPFLKHYKISPVTGKPMVAKDLIKLNFFKNSKGEYHCPVTYKVFNENTHIVAVKPTGNVFAMDAVDRLNIKAKHWKDLITDDSFGRADIITIQDPNNLDKFNISAFHHVKNNLKVLDEDEELSKKDPKYHLKSINAETRDVLTELDSTYKAPEKVELKKQRADKFNAAHYSTGHVAASFTSTAMVPQTHHEAAIIDENVVLYARIKKKGYVRLLTNKGILNLQLHCDMVPKVCHNFVMLCGRGYYKNTIFHRSIRNFMVQGGDPTGTGTGGESAWGKPFEDHFKPNLTHTGRGVLSMANSGPDTNKSQFFITYRSCRHLDGKHSVFGRVVGGLETIDKIEAVKTDKKDAPESEIKIIDTQVFINPFEEAEEELKKERETEETKNTVEKAPKPKTEKMLSKPVAFTAGVGKYINPKKKNKSEEKGTVDEPVKKKSKTSSGLNNFSSW